MRRRDVGARCSAALLASGDERSLRSLHDDEASASGGGSGDRGARSGTARSPVNVRPTMARFTSERMGHVSAFASRALNSATLPTRAATLDALAPLPPSSSPPSATSSAAAAKSSRAASARPTSKAGKGKWRARARGRRALTVLAAPTPLQSRSASLKQKVRAAAARAGGALSDSAASQTGGGIGERQERTPSPPLASLAAIATTSSSSATASTTPLTRSAEKKTSTRDEVEHSRRRAQTMLRKQRKSRTALVLRAVSNERSDMFEHLDDVKK